MIPSARYHAGVAAEDSVARHYAARGFTVAARRWRGKAGEVVGADTEDLQTGQALMRLPGFKPRKAITAGTGGKGRPD